MKEEFKKLNTKQLVSAWKEFLDDINNDWSEFYEYRTWKKLNFPDGENIPENMENFNEKNPYHLTIDDFYDDDYIYMDEDDLYEDENMFEFSFDPTDEYYIITEDGTIDSRPDWRMAEEIKHYIRTMDNPAAFNWYLVSYGYSSLEDFTDEEIIAMAMEYFYFDQNYAFDEYFQNRFGIDYPEDDEENMMNYYQPYLSLMAAGLA